MRADVGMAAAGLAVLALALARVGPAPAGPVEVVGAGLHQVVAMGCRSSPYMR